MTWGASQELLTSRGYERLRESTDNPVGSGVKSGDEVQRLVDAVFPGSVIDRAMGDIQRRISASAFTAVPAVPAARSSFRRGTGALGGRTILCCGGT